MKNFSDLPGYNKIMGILENFENAWDVDFQNESAPMKITNHIGETSLAVKIFSETCCNGCSCQSEQDHKSSN